jgi:hypothetical protein
MKKFYIFFILVTAIAWILVVSIHHKAGKLDVVSNPDQQEKQKGVAKMNSGTDWAIACFAYAHSHQGQFPTDFNQAVAFFPDTNDAASLLASNEFEIVYRGSISNMPDPNNIIVIRDKQGWWNNNTYLKTYIFGDGHVEIHNASETHIEPWETSRLQKTTIQ